MATEAVVRQSRIQRTVTFYHDVVAELKKVTWPELTQVRQLSISVVILSLFIGILIWLMDLIFQTLLVRWIPALFGG